MIEDDAKTKWCPFVRIIIYKNEIIDNRAGSSATYGDPYCVGSACMAWRATDNEIKENPSGPVVSGRAMMTSDYVSAGYCGLAGKP